MKRKIRKDRQVRLQMFKEKKRHEELTDDWYAKDLFEILSSHTYWLSASQSLFAFIYVDYHWGTELFAPQRYYFLFNRISQNIKYGMYTFETSDGGNNQSNQPVFKEFGGYHIENTVFIDDMLSFKPKLNSHYYDASYYEIVVKSGNRKRYICIQSPEKDKYEPYKWLFNLIKAINL